MNVFLWVLQAVLAVLFGMAGAAKIFMFEKIADGVASNQALSRGAWTWIGVLEVLCALAFVAPAATGRLAVLAPIAGVCLAVEGLAVAWLHYSYSEYSPVVFTLLLAIFAAFVAYERLAVRPS
jgi:hypothetical protein